MSAFNLSVVVLAVVSIFSATYGLNLPNWGAHTSGSLTISNEANYEMVVKGFTGKTLCNCKPQEICDVPLTTLAKELFIAVTIKGKTLTIAIEIIYYFCMTLAEFRYLVIFYIEAIKMPCYTMSCNLNCTYLIEPDW